MDTMEMALDHITIDERPDTAALLAMLNASCINSSNSDTLTLIGRGIYFLYFKRKLHRITQG